MDEHANSLTISKPSEPRYWQEVNASQWVDRDREKSVFNSAIERIQQGAPEDIPILEFHGGAGIGKSTLTQILYHEAQTGPGHCALINFKFIYNQIQNNPLHLIEILLDLLYRDVHRTERPAEKALRTWINSYRQGEGANLSSLYSKWMDDLVALIENRPLWLNELDQIKRLVIAVVAELAKEPIFPTPIIVIFDETEWTRPWLDRWIKDYLVTPLVLSRQCLVVWTGRRSTRWSHPEMNRRMLSIEVERFTEAGLKEQLALRSDDPDLAEALFGHLFQVTLGHPSATSIAYRQISAWASQGDYNSVLQQISQNRSLLYRQIFQELLINHAFGNLPPDQQLSEPEQKACQLLSMVRIFDNHMLEAILSNCGVDMFDNYNTEDFAHLMRKLRGSQFVMWNRGNTLEENLRVLVRRYYQHNNRDLYYTVNQQAKAVYNTWLEKPIDSRGLYTQEDLYHALCLAELNPAIDVVAELQQRLSEFGRRINDKDALHSAIDRLWNEINTDNEIRELAKPGIYAQLLSIISEYLDSLPG